jgi:hypothetical protein
MYRVIAAGESCRPAVGSVFFHATVTDAVGTIVRHISQDPPTYLVKLLFSFHGVDEVEVPQESDRCQVSSLNGRIPSIRGAALQDSLSIQKTCETAKQAT